MKLEPTSRLDAFTLMELVFVLAVIAVLLLVGASVANGSRLYGRRVCVDQLVGVFDQARSRAMIRHRPMMVAIVDPSDVDGVGQARVGVFQMDQWLGLTRESLVAARVSAWWFMHPGVIIDGGSSEGMINPRDVAELLLCDADGSNGVRVHAVVFGAQGQVIYPVGEEPVEVRITDGKVIHNQIRVGRATGRSYALAP